MLGAVNRFADFAAKVVELLDWQISRLVSLKADTNDFATKLVSHSAFVELRKSLARLASLKANGFEGVHARFTVLQHNVIVIVESAASVRTLVQQEGNPRNQEHVAQALTKFLVLLPDEAFLESWDSLNLPRLPGRPAPAHAVVESVPEPEGPLPIVEEAMRAGIAEHNPIYKDPYSEGVGESLLFLHLLSNANARARDILYNLYPRRKSHPDLERLAQAIMETTWHLEALRKGQDEALRLLRRDASTIYAQARSLTDPYRSAAIIAELGYAIVGGGRTSEATLAYNRLGMFTGASQVFAADLLKIPARRIQREPFAQFQDTAVTLSHNARQLLTLLDPLTDPPKGLWGHFMRILQRRIGLREEWTPLSKEEGIPLLTSIAAEAEIMRAAAIRGFAREFTKELWVDPTTKELVDDLSGPTAALLRQAQDPRKEYEVQMPVAALKGFTDSILGHIKGLKQEYAKQLPTHPAPEREKLSSRMDASERLIQEMLRKAEALPTLRERLPKHPGGSRRNGA
jgi:hypothetical protein